MANEWLGKQIFGQIYSSKGCGDQVGVKTEEETFQVTRSKSLLVLINTQLSL